MSTENSSAKQPCDLQSVIRWVTVSEKLPELDTEVLVVTKDGWVGYGQRSERLIVERSENGRYRPTNKKQIEWGIEENGGEYWCKLKNVVLWAPFPEPPCV